MSVSIDETREISDSIMIESFVTQIYRHIFSRDPDPEGLYSHSNSLRRRLSEEQIGRFVLSAVTSPEGVNKLLGRMLINKLSADQDLTQPPVSAVVSLGSHCYTAGLLERFGLRHSSWPFDWIFSSPSMVAHCLKDRFETFLDKSYYDPVPATERGPHGEGHCEHIFYKRKFGIRHIFNHHDPLIDAEYEMYVRRTQRLLSLLESDVRKLLLLVVRRFNKSEYEAVSAALVETGKNYELIYVSVEAPDPGRLTAEAEIKKPNPTDTLISLSPVSTLGGLAFTDWTDELPIVKYLFKQNISQHLNIKSAESIKYQNKKL